MVVSAWTDNANWLAGAKQNLVARCYRLRQRGCRTFAVFSKSWRSANRGGFRGTLQVRADAPPVYRRDTRRGTGVPAALERLGLTPIRRPECFRTLPDLS